MKIEFDTSDLNICLVVLSLYICGYGLISYVVKHRLLLSEPLVALLFGIVVGPAVLGWVDPNLWKSDADKLLGYRDSLTLTITRVVIGIQVFFAGVALPKQYLKTEFQSLVVLLLPVMAAAWFVCGLLIFQLIPRLTFLEALLIGACITPTDPVLANSITKGRFAEQSVSVSIRNIIVAESGANDGLGYPFVYLPLFFLMARSSEKFDAPNRHISGIFARWTYETWLYQVVLSIVLGLAIGWVARVSLRWCEERKLLDEDNFVAYGTGLCFFCLGFLGIIGSDDLLCCFIAGNSFSWDDRQRLAAEDAGFQDIIDLLLNAAVFMYIGAIIPWNAYNDLATGITLWRIIVLAVCVLVFRRLPWVVVLYKFIPAVGSLKEAVFVGWFGPIGVSAIFYVQIVLEHLPKESREQVKLTVEPVVYFMVFASVLVHGITVPMSKVLMHGVVLTRTWSRSESLIWGNPTLPVTVDSVRRIGIPAPVPWYSGSTSGKFDDSDGSSSRRFTPGPEVQSSTSRVGAGGSGAGTTGHEEVERDIEAVPEVERRTVV
ncbi:hypothetical protein BDV93DRAFT_518754 [Ceratobasidium sp. AG-I]|nr:hypothetical protein BDV93DRAFT_518754 [Ceratobasidium sp. AG-I]